MGGLLLWNDATSWKLRERGLGNAPSDPSVVGLRMRSSERADSMPRHDAAGRGQAADAGGQGWPHCEKTGAERKAAIQLRTHRGRLTADRSAGRAASLVQGGVGTVCGLGPADRDLS